MPRRGKRGNSGYVSSHGHDGSKKHTFATFDSLQQGLLANAQQRFMQCGDMVVQQLSGLLIGNTTSGASNGIAIWSQFQTFVADTKTRQEKRWWLHKIDKHAPHARKLDLTLLLAGLLYEDDLVLASKLLCEECLDCIVQTIFQDSSIVMEKQHRKVSSQFAKCHMLGWLDLQIHFGSLFAFSRPQSESQWLMGVQANMSKQRIPIFVSPKTTSLVHLKATMIGRLKRFTECNLQHPQLVLAVTCGICILLRAGYSKPLVCGIFRAKPFPYISKLVRQFLFGALSVQQAILSNQD